MGEKAWRFRLKQLIRDEKINIRKNWVLKNFNFSLPILYFLILYSFIEKYFLDKSFYRS